MLALLDYIPNVFCWSHAEFNSPYKDLRLRDGVHVNPTGQYFLYRCYAPVIVKPQGGGAGHTPGDLTFYHFFMSNSLPREQQVVSNIPSLGGNCNN